RPRAHSCEPDPIAPDVSTEPDPDAAHRADERSRPQPGRVPRQAPRSPEQHRHRAAGSVRPPAAWVSARSAWDPVAPAAARPCRRAGDRPVEQTPRTAYSANRPPRQPAVAYRVRTALPQCWTSPDPR